MVVLINQGFQFGMQLMVYHLMKTQLTMTRLLTPSTYVVVLVMTSTLMVSGFNQMTMVNSLSQLVRKENKIQSSVLMMVVKMSLLPLEITHQRLNLHGNMQMVKMNTLAQQFTQSLVVTQMILLFKLQLLRVITLRPLLRITSLVKFILVL